MSGGAEYKNGRAQLEGFRDSLSKRDLVEALRQQDERISELEGQLESANRDVLAFESSEAYRILERKLDERAEDTERLDWLVRDCDLIRKSQRVAWHYLPERGTFDGPNGERYRAAIDAAMRKGKK